MPVNRIRQTTPNLTKQAKTKTKEERRRKKANWKKMKMIFLTRGMWNHRIMKKKMKRKKKKRVKSDFVDEEAEVSEEEDNGDDEESDEDEEEDDNEVETELEEKKCEKPSPRSLKMKTKTFDMFMSQNAEMECDDEDELPGYQRGVGSSIVPSMITPAHDKVLLSPVVTLTGCDKTVGKNLQDSSFLLDSQTPSSPHRLHHSPKKLNFDQEEAKSDPTDGIPTQEKSLVGGLDLLLPTQGSEELEGLFSGKFPSQSINAECLEANDERGDFETQTQAVPQGVGELLGTSHSSSNLTAVLCSGAFISQPLDPKQLELNDGPCDRFLLTDSLSTAGEQDSESEPRKSEAPQPVVVATNLLLNRSSILSSDEDEEDMNISTNIGEKPKLKKRKRLVYSDEEEEEEGNADDNEEESEDEVDLTSGEMRNEMVEPESNKAPDIPEDASYEKLNYKRLGRHFLTDFNSDKGARVSCASYHQSSKVLVVGFSNGSFYLLEMPDVNLIHSLSISESEISAVSFNVTGDWLALGCSERGQLLVWEWQSETYVLKQQGHSNSVSSVAYSHDGQFIASGGEDGKVKLWNVHTGFCFVTFSEHDSPVSAVHFSNTRKFVLSASVDGTVRAFDLTRYRNFRTFTTPRPVQLNCLSLDSTSEFVAAGGQDVFEIYIWSMKLGRLLEVLSGHEGPVSCVEFSPVLSSTGMVSVSWDKTVKLWNAVETSTQHETIHLTSDALCVAYKPDGTEIVVSTLDGQLLMFNVESAAQVGSIEARRDLDTGRLDTDLITREQTLKAKAVSTLCYSADGSSILAAGQSKHICIYSSREGILLKKFSVTQNKSLDGINDFINRRKMTEFGNVALVETRESREGGNVHLKLPGVRSGDMAARVLKPEVRVFSVKFSPTGQAWVAATTEGVHIFSLDPGHVFDPFLLDISITPQSVKEALADQDYAKAVMMSLKLNEQNLIIHVLESVRTQDIALTVRSLAEVYQEKLLKVIAAMLEVSKHIEFYVTWAMEILNHLRSPSQTTMVHLQRNLNKKYGDLAKICDFNIYTLQLISRLGPLRIKPKIEKMELNSSDEDEDTEEEEEDAEIRVLEEQEVGV
uniref:Periodic tryptophan protein 2 homolog n=1 Tax=Cacopsylla melanoneura TaxID=428564 RepID=A0A8D8SE18_9HEMI